MAITFKVGFQVDDKELKSGLQGIQTDIQNAFNIKTGMTDEIAKATQQAQLLEKAIKRATTDKGISYYSLNSELIKAGSSAAKLTSTLASGGQQFAASLNAANTAFATADRSLLSLNGKIKEMSRVVTQSFKFTAAQTFLQSVSNAAREAYQWVYDLNKTITDISVVTGYQGDQLDKVTKNAIEGAERLRIAANEYAQGALIFYQQGLGDDEVARRTEITAKAAAAAGSSLQDMSSQLTAIWNTYKMVGDEQQRAASVGAKMAADTAVDFADIAEAMQTAAAPAEQMGVSYNSLAAIIATVGDTTQQSASVIGNAFKTIFSRFQQLKSEGTDGEVTLNRVSSQLQELGVSVLDSAGNLRSLDTVIAEVGDQWDDWSSKQQLAIAQLVGGTRQYGQFLTLMNNFDKYQDLLSSANIEDGSTLEQQYESTLESIESKALNAGEAWSRAFGQLIDEDAVKGFYDILEGIGDLLGGFLDNVGGIRAGFVLLGTYLSSKIIPFLTQAGKQAITLATNLTRDGRKANINKEFNANKAALDKNLEKGSINQGDYEAASQKNEFSRQTAQINDKINTALRKATGEYKLQLEYARDLVKSAQELFQISVDQAKKQEEALQKEQQRVQAARDYAQAARLSAANTQKDLAKQEMNAATGKVGGLTRSVNQIQTQIQNTEDESEKAALIEKLTQKQQELAQATREAEIAQENYNKAVAAVHALERGTSTDPTEKKVLSAQKLETAYNDMALALSEYQRKAAVNDESADFEKVRGAIQNTINKLKDLAIASDAPTEQIDELSQKLSQIDDVSGVDELITQINGLSQAMNNLPQNENVDLNIDTTSADELMSTAGDVRRARGQQDQGEETLRGGDQNGRRGFLSGDPQTIGQVAQGITQIGVSAGMAVMQVTSLFDALGQAETVPEKLAAIGSNLLMLIPSIVSIATSFDLAAIGAKLFGNAAMSAGAKSALAFGLIGVAVLAVVAAIAGLVALWKDNAMGSAEGQLKKQREALEGLTSAAEEAQTAADNLRTSIENYDTAVDKLNDCVVGTEEWRDALQEANESAMELISNLPDNADISGLYKRNAETGLIEFDEDKLEQVQEQADQQATQAQYAAQIGEVSVQQKSNVVDLQNLGDSIYDESSMAKTASQIEGIIADHMDEFMGALDATQFADLLEKYGVTLTGTEAEIESLRQQTIQLGQSMQNASDKAELFAGIQVDNILGDDYSAEVKQMVTEGLSSRQDELEDDYLGKLTNNSSLSDDSYYYGDIAKQMSEIPEKLMNEYNQLTGKNWASSGNGVQGTDNNRIFEFINEEGEIVQLRAEQVAAEMAAAKALEEVTGSAESAAKALENLDSDYAEDFNNFIQNGNFNSMTEDELNSTFEKDKEGNVTLESAREYAENALGGEQGLREMVAATLGKSAADITDDEINNYVQKIADAAEISFTALDSVGSNLTDRAKKAFDNMVDEGTLKGLTADQQMNVTDMVAQVFEGGGTQAVEKLQEVFDGIDDTVLPDVIDELEGIDWQNISPGQLQEQLEQAGIATDDFAASLPILIELMKEAAGIDFSTASQQYKDFKAIADSISSDRNIDEDAYKKLEEAGIQVDNFVTKLQDGTYAVTGDVDEFYNLVMQKSGQGFDQLKQQVDDQYNTISTVQSRAESYNAVEGQDYYKDVLQANAWQKDDATGQYAYNYDLIAQQLDYIKARTGEVNAEWQDALNNQTMDYDTRKAILDEINRLGDDTEDFAQAMGDAADNAKEVEDAMALQETLDEGALAGIDSKEILELGEHIQDIADDNEELADSLEDDAAAAAEVAKEIKRYDKAVEDVTDNYDDWMDALESGNLEDQAEAFEGMEDAYGNLLDIDGSQLSDDFLGNVENLELMKEAINGNTEAYNELAQRAQQDILMQLNIDPNTNAELYNEIMSLTSQIQSYVGDIPIGATIDDTAALQAMTDLINAAGMTADQATAYLSSMGVDAEVETTDVPRETSHTYTNATPSIEWHEEEGTNPVTGEPATYRFPEVSYNLDPVETTEEQTDSAFALKVTSATKSSGGNFKHLNSTSGSGNGSKPTGNGGGGGSAPKHKAKKAKKRESIKVDDRYSTIKASIDDVQREMDKFSANQDDMWGGAKLNALKKYNKELRQQAGYYRELLDSARDYLDQDMDAQAKARAEAEEALGASLIQAQQNDDGYIKNRTEIINQLDDLLQAKYDQYKAAADAFDADKSTDEARSEQIDKLKEEYDDLEEIVNDYIASLDQVDDTAKEAEEALQKLVEGIREEIANKVEEITYKIELQVEINDLELEQIERTIEHLGDVGVITGRKFGLLSQSFKESQESANLAVQGIRQLEGMINNLNTAAGQEQFIKVYGQEAWDEYAASGILPEEAIDGIKDYIGDLTSAIDDMYSKMEDLFDTYLDALEMFADKFDQIADKLSHNIDKLDTYQEILEFSGQGWTAQGQTARNTIAQARVSTTQANLQLATSEYETYKSQYDDWMSEVEKFQDEHGKDIANYDEATAAAWNKIEETRQELYSKMNEAEGEIYSNMQELVSNIADAIEVGAEVITEQISDSLGGMFYDFDSMMDEYNQREELRLFFLEDYDKTYQLESLLRDIDDVMDDVTDPGRLQEYQSLIDEINAANEEGVQITQNDVDLLKAKFELQKAQDAYEEQMNAKNTMRLARDASGNWNYVYSQDQSQTEDAAQALADAQYNYDKLLHEVRDESSELWLQTQQEFFQWQQEIDQSRLQWDTQYREQVERTTKYYLELTQRYADQVDKYNNLLGESYSSTTLGVVTGYDKMQDAQFNYSEKHKEYNSKLEQNTVQWEGVMQEECKKVGLDYNNLAKDVTSAASNIMAENTALEGDVKSLQQTANTALTNMQKNVWSNVNSMISAIKALEAELQRAIQLLQTLTNKSLMSGYDENTDYTDYLHTDYAAYTAAGGKMGMSEWLDMYHSQDIWERMGAGADRGIYAGKDYDEAKDLIIDSYNPDATYINGNQYNFGEGTSGKYLNDWSNIKDQEVDLDYDNLEEVIVKGKRASGGIVNEHGLYELAEDGTEFVLNPDDTKNILSAVKAMREVVRMKMSGLDSALGSKTNEVVKKTVVNKDIQQLDQQVHIDATFPNVSVAKEIEEAFSNLVNQAVQYASAQKNSRQG